MNHPVPAPLSNVARRTQKTAPLSSTGVAFLTETGSPFVDGYSIKLEQEAVGHLDKLTDNDLQRHPELARWELLQDRIAMLEKMRNEAKGHNGADTAVPYAYTKAIKNMGRLVTVSDASDQADAIVLHTKQAYRLFIGRRRDPERNLTSIPSAMRIGTVLRILHDLSRFDNPYADWALLRANEHISTIKAVIGEGIQGFKTRLNDLAEQGLKIHVLRSSTPEQFKLEFASAYGYMLSESIVQYDYFVRMTLTMVQKGQLKDSDLRPTLSRVTHLYRSFFTEMVRYERVLCGAELRALSRHDYLPTADAEAKKRVKAVTEIFGVVPEPIFKGEMVPPHTKRQAAATAQDMALLNQVYDNLVRQASDEDGNGSKGSHEGSEPDGSLL